MYICCNIWQLICFIIPYVSRNLNFIEVHFLYLLFFPMASVKFLIAHPVPLYHLGIKLFYIFLSANHRF